MKLCLTIGVSKAQPLAGLPGAITAAYEIGAWAQAAGFVTRIVTDEGSTPVTIPRLRAELEDMLPKNDKVELFILHFAGHGYRTGAEQNIWLPSDFHHEMRGISVEGLKKQLYRYGISNLTILSDACRSMPNDIEIADMVADPILPRGPYNIVAPAIDRFNAVSDGGRAFMLNGDSHSPPRCVFSTILLEGLSGQFAGAFDKYLPDCIIPESLAIFSGARTEEICELYRLDCIPEFSTGIPREHIIYHRKGPAFGNVPPMPVWPKPPEGPDAIVTSWQTGPEQWYGHRLLERQTQEERREYTRRSFVFDERAIKIGINLIVLGRQPVRVWTNTYSRRRRIKPFCFAVGVDAGGATQVLIEFSDGTAASAVVYFQLVTILSLDENGVIGWTCVNRWENIETQISQSIEAIANLQYGTLAANEVDQIAVTLRRAKHINPVSGAIASYLYDYAGDIDSIRRMAYFYCYYGQPIPFDVAFLGLLPHADFNVDYHVSVPAVAARRAKEDPVQLPSWVTRATETMTGDVAGNWPWLRQGWDFVEDPEPLEKASADNIRDVIPHLLPSQFSSFQRRGMEILIDRFGLEGFE